MASAARETTTSAVRCVLAGESVLDAACRPRRVGVDALRICGRVVLGAHTG